METAGDLDCGDKLGGRDGVPAFPKRVGAEVPAGGGVPCEGSRGATGVLRLPGRALAAHLRTTNPIESSFATVRLRTVKTRGCLSRKTEFAMVYRLVISAQGKWRRLNGTESLSKVIEGVRFEDGIQVVKRPA